jgi:FkbM family methyltransferase
LARSAIARLGLKCVKAGIKPPRLNALERYREQFATKHLLERFDINVVLDVGGNNGMYASALRGLGYRGSIISFEPIPEELAKIQALSANDPNWRAYQLAIGSENCTKTFNIIQPPEGGTFYSSFLQPDGAPAVTRPVEVTVRRLDNILPDLLKGISQTRIFLKSDTQGYDLEVAKGLGELIEKVVALQVEASVVPIYKGMPHYLQTLAYFEQLGFSLMDLRVIDRTPQGVVYEYDCVMARV